MVINVKNPEREFGVFYYLKLYIMLVLEDLKGKTEIEIKDHLKSHYSGDEISTESVAKLLENLEVLIAYESVGKWGCDSTSFFVFKDKDGNLYEMHGSHCSCYGFEDQFKLEETESKALWYRMNESKRGVFRTGGYDYNEDKNIAKVHKYIKENI
jgi:hypothetical protein